MNMTTFKLEISMDNDATTYYEDVADLLEAVAEKLRDGDNAGNIIDYNGNGVGSYWIEEE